MEKARELGAEAVMQMAAYDEVAREITGGNLQNRAIDVLVVVPSNDVYTAAVIDAARGKGVPVIVYDKMVEGCNPDLYLSFDNIQVGHLQAEYLVKRVPKGDYVVIGGPKGDPNAKWYRQGQMEILKPFLDRFDIKIVEDQAAKDWLPLEGLRITREALAKTGGKLDAVLASNDGVAGGALQALSGAPLSARIPVTGQDADLAACQRIAQGSQLMTVYKPIKRLAIAAAEAAVALAKKEPLPGMVTKFLNGHTMVPAILLDPIAVERTNLVTTVVADGFHSETDVFIDSTPPNRLSP
jgi:D-xylose transport system substrate-binding protein